ncbi:N-acetyl-D-Glu racemase DgcA [Microbaculum marinisediminis]|uniref:Dipeptide epimerase n=1 Tax=Microbaculum marinisediminis TaxID=2931392 RepID=A0AAW5QX17_9HYPH|nr:N-acetyl-D-Glu racemase DgcA [Microbaculum sp. A6E488]MCT8972495.1 dipeptide epimerase [Microbaculum sp. A6E488]
MKGDLTVSVESWPIAGGFTISRGTKTEATVVVAEIRTGAHLGRGECVPYARYGETVEGIRNEIAGLADKVAHGLSREELATLLPAGAARNALDCALWDLEAKEKGRSVRELAGLSVPKPLVTAYTLSLGTPDAMREAARKAAHRQLLKVKLGGDGDAERIAAVREGAPNARVIVDANEGWSPADIETLLAACADAGVELVEQPLPADADEVLANIHRPITVCADESIHDRASLTGLSARYDAINIKLDKTGGLTEALALSKAARQDGIKVMVGCMLATSLAMAPAMLIAQDAEWVDLDGPLLLARDRQPGLRYEGSEVFPPEPGLWG